MTSLIELRQRTLQQQKNAPRHCLLPRQDARVWNYTFAHAQADLTIFRFLPAHPDEQDEIKAFLRHTVLVPKGRGWTYMQPCAGKDRCPVCLYRANGHEGFRELSDRQRYASNILMVQDPIKPENNGKVFIYEFGRDVHGILLETMMDNSNPFDCYQKNGNELQLRAAWYNPKGVPKYTKDSFLTIDGAPLEGDVPKRHRLSEYPLMHAEEEMSYQFQRTLGSSLVEYR